MHPLYSTIELHIFIHVINFMGISPHYVECSPRISSVLDQFCFWCRNHGLKCCKLMWSADAIEVDSKAEVKFLFNKNQ